MHFLNKHAEEKTTLKYLIHQLWAEEKAEK